MNQYSDNLRNSIVNLLQSQWLAQRALYSQLNTDIFSLFDAQGAVITASDTLQESKIGLALKAAVKQEAVKSSNLSSSILSAEEQAGQQMNQSVTNAALCAADVQMATDAILRLAGDVGNIHNLLCAADSDTDDCKMSGQIHQLMNDTASHAEKAAQLSMEASMLTAEVSFASVTDDANSTNTLMTGLQQLLISGFDTASQLADKNEAALAEAGIQEKLAEATLEEAGLAYHSYRQAYNATNKGLNLNLTAVLVQRTDLQQYIEVSFDQLTDPFENSNSDFSGLPDSTSDNKLPLQAYYILIVPEEKRTIFSLSDAENLVAKSDTVLYIQIPVPVADGPDKSGNIIGQTDIRITVDIPVRDGSIAISDTDGNPVIPGSNYVVFVLAQYTEKYKQFLNDSDDFLSAPTTPFAITQTLAAATVAWAGSNLYVIAPKTTETSPVQYRCLFLPNGSQVPEGLLTANGLAELNRKLHQLAANKSNDASGSDNPVATAVTEATQFPVTEYDTQNAKSATADNLPFFFMLSLAENVPASNYTVAIPVSPDWEIPSAINSLLPSTEPLIDFAVWQVPIDGTTTDVFGNPVSDPYTGNENNVTYQPVVLSVSAAPQQDLPRFISRLSHYQSDLLFSPAAISNQNQLQAVQVNHLTTPGTSMPPVPDPQGKYGITEGEKAILSKLKLQVWDAQQNVDQLTTLVTLLTQKLSAFQASLSAADADCTQALNLKNPVDQLVSSALNLANDSKISYTQASLANQRMQQAASETNKVIHKFIYTADLLNKLSSIIIGHKASDPLVSDELINQLEKAGTDANNAIALTLVALNTAYAAQASNIESADVSALVTYQASRLLESLTGNPLSIQASPDMKNPDCTEMMDSNAGHLQVMLACAYHQAQKQYEVAQDACNRVSDQLNNAKADLSKAQVNLKSLQAGLAAANAAAFS